MPFLLMQIAQCFSTLDKATQSGWQQAQIKYLKFCGLFILICGLEKMKFRDIDQTKIILV